MLAKNVIIEAQRKGKQQLIFISNGLVLSDKAIKVGQYLSSLFDSEREFDLKICHNNKNFVLKCQPSLYEANIFFFQFLFRISISIQHRLVQGRFQQILPILQWFG